MRIVMQTDPSDENRLWVRILCEDLWLTDEVAWQEAVAAHNEEAERFERAAASKVQIARNFIERGMTDTARTWLRKAIDDYPETEAAKEAEEILAELD